MSTSPAGSAPSGRILRSHRRISQSRSQPRQQSGPHSEVQQLPPQSTTAQPTSNACSKKRKASQNTPLDPNNASSDPAIPDELSAIGFTIGSKTPRNRLLELLNQYGKTKRPRRSDSCLPKRIPSAQEVRPRPKRTSDPEFLDTQVVRSRIALANVDFNTYTTSDLVKMVEGVGLEGNTMAREALVQACKEHRELIILPSQGFAFTFAAKPPPKSTVTKSQDTHPPKTPHLDEGTISKRTWKGKGKAQSPVYSSSSESECDQEVLSESLILQVDQSRQQPPRPLVEAAYALQPGPSRELGATNQSAGPSSLPPQKSTRSQRESKSKRRAPVQNSEAASTVPSLEHSRLLYPRPPPTILSPPAPRDSQQAKLTQSDDEWSPDKEATRDLSDLSEGSKKPDDSDCPSIPPSSATRSRKRKASSRPSRPRVPESLPTSPVGSTPECDNARATDTDSCEEPDNKVGRLKKIVFRLKHTLKETNQRLEKSEKQLKVLANLLNTTTELGQSPSPSKKTRGGRSASWMRKHIDTLIGRKPEDSRLPPPATDAEQEAWKSNINLNILNPDTTPSQLAPASSNPSFPYPRGPGHVEATPQQLAVMYGMMRAAGVSSFRPDFSKPSTCTENKFLWALAFRIFIKLVECGEYSGVSINIENIAHLRKAMHTRIRSLTKQYQQEAWADDRKKRAASNARSCARLRYLKKNRERLVLSHQSLWLLSPIIQSACSDDETEHEDCHDPFLDEHKSPCHIRKLTWRSDKLENIFIILDKYRVRLDQSIPKPNKSSQKQKPTQDNQNTSTATNGRPPRPRLRCPNGSITSLPPPQGLPVDCYSSEWLETLTAAERIDLEIDPAPILSSILSSVESL